MEIWSVYACTQRKKGVLTSTSLYRITVHLCAFLLLKVKDKYSNSQNVWGFHPSDKERYNFVLFLMETYIGWHHKGDLLIIKAVHGVGSTVQVDKSNEGTMEGDTSSLSLARSLSRGRSPHLSGPDQEEPRKMALREGKAHRQLSAIIPCHDRTRPTVPLVTCVSCQFVCLCNPSNLR